MRIAILTVSDRSWRGERADLSGPALAAEVAARGWTASETDLVPDERSEIERILAEIADHGRADVILTTGGTGLAPRDVTPEATRAVVARTIPGMPEAMRAASLRATPNAMLSRAEAGVRKTCIIVNLPGSPKGALECFRVIAPALEHAVALVKGEQADGRAR